MCFIKFEDAITLSETILKFRRVTQNNTMQTNEFYLMCHTNVKISKNKRELGKCVL